MERLARKAFSAAALASLALFLCDVPAGADSNVIIKMPDEIAFGESVGGKPQIAVLYGDPAKPEFFVLRMRFPAGFKVEPHTHPEGTRTLTVLSGTLYFGFGESFDEAKTKPFPPGTFFTELPTTPHFVWAKDGDVIVQVAGIGPTGFVPTH